MAQTFKSKLIFPVAFAGLLLAAAPSQAQRSTPVTVTNPVAVQVQNNEANPVSVADSSRQPFYQGVFLNHGNGSDTTCRSFSAPPDKVITMRAIHVRVRGITEITNPAFRPDIFLEQIEASRAPIPTRRSTLRVTDMQPLMPGASSNDFGGTLLTNAPMAGALGSGTQLSFNVCFERLFGASGSFIAADITLYGDISEGQITPLTP